MKKTTLLSLALAFCASTAALAQDEEYNDTFEFCSEDGTIIPNGSTININTATMSPDEEIALYTGVYVKNTASVLAYGSVDWTVTKIDNGSFSVCFPMQCNTSDKVGKIQNSPGVIRANEVKSTQSEWYPQAAGEAEMTMTLTIYSCEFVDNVPYYTKEDEGPTITLHFNYDPTGINEVSKTQANDVVARYTVGGQQIAAPAKGLNIVKMADGTTKKVLVK